MIRIFIEYHSFYLNTTSIEIFVEWLHFIQGHEKTVLYPDILVYFLKHLINKLKI